MAGHRYTLRYYFQNGTYYKTLWVSVASTILVTVIYLLLDSPDEKFLLGMATAHTGIILLSVTLMIGPLKLIRGRAYPVITNLRRDMGIWIAVISIIHVMAGMQLHMGGRIWPYYFHM